MQLIARLSMVDPEIERKRIEEEKASLQLISRMSQMELECRGQGQAAAAPPAPPATSSFVPRTEHFHNQQSSSGVSQFQLDDHTWTKVRAKERSKNNADTKKQLNIKEESTERPRCLASEEWRKEIQVKEIKTIEKEKKTREESQKIRLIPSIDNSGIFDAPLSTVKESGLRTATLADAASRKSVTEKKAGQVGSKESGRRLKNKQTGMKDFEIERKKGAAVTKERLAAQAKLRDEKMEKEALAREWAEAQRRKVSQAIGGLAKKTKKQ